jgi:hypothetical protein
MSDYVLPRPKYVAFYPSAEGWVASGGRSGRVSRIENILPPTGFEIRTFEYVESRYID